MSMALSFYNWSGHDTAYSSIVRPPSSSPELFTFHEDYTFYETKFNPLFDPNYSNIEVIPSLASCNYSDILPPVISTGNVLVPSPELQVSGFTYQDPYYNVPNSATFNHAHLSQFCTEYTMVPKLPSELPPLPEIYQGGGCAATLPPWYDSRRGNRIDQVEESCINIQVKKQNVGNGRGSLSAQSMAARVRRRKISEKTQELGKLIPGGHKMNTAEMFQAAFKYIKFLQAQAGVLKLMNSISETEEVLRNGEMQAMVTCTLMQEKLYTEEKCIMPKHFAETPSK